MSHKNWFRTVSLLVVFALLLAWRLCWRRRRRRPAPQGLRQMRHRMRGTAPLASAYTRGDWRGTDRPLDLASGTQR